MDAAGRRHMRRVACGPLNVVASRFLPNISVIFLISTVIWRLEKPLISDFPSTDFYLISKNIQIDFSQRAYEISARAAPFGCLLAYYWRACVYAPCAREQPAPPTDTRPAPHHHTHTLKNAKRAALYNPYLYTDNGTSACEKLALSTGHSYILRGPSNCS